MKNYTKMLCILVSIMILFALPTKAKSGDIAGKYYATDIKTYLNGTEISAINIGGETLISGEDMAHYGFSVWWDGNERTLRIQETTGVVEDSVSLVPDNTIPAGTEIGYYYETDIVTYLDTVPITAYNIGGRTYIHAEEMRKFGYLVDWSATTWTLRITSPRPAGYVYDLNLSYGSDKGWGNGNPGIDGIGVCSLKYTKETLLGTDDADYFDMRMYSTGRGYRFEMKFYQNQALFNAGLLMDNIRPLCYDGYGVETPCDKSEKYDLVNQMVSISMNGRKAEKVSVLSGAGNGHRDFYFEVEDLPKITKDEIEEICFMVGDAQGDPYEIMEPEYFQ